MTGQSVEIPLQTVHRKTGKPFVFYHVETNLISVTRGD